MFGLSFMQKNIIKYFFRKRIKRNAIKNSLKIRKVLQKELTLNEIAEGMCELHCIKHDFDDSICYSFTVKKNLNGNNQSLEKKEINLPQITFKMISFPRSWRYEFKELYMETFEEAFKLGKTWDFDMIMRFSISRIDDIC